MSAVALAPDGQRAVSASIDGDVRRWDVATGHVVEAWQTPRVAAVAILGDRTAVAADQRAWVYGGETWTLPGFVTALSTGEGTVGDARYRLDPGGVATPVEPRDPSSGPYDAFPVQVTAAAWSPAGFVTGHEDGTVRVWSVVR